MASEWQRYEVADLIARQELAIGDGYRAKNEELGKHGLPFARAGNINEGFQFANADRFPEDNLHRLGNKVSAPGDVVFTSKGTVGRFAYVRDATPRFVYSPQLCFWRSLDRTLIDARFLYYWMYGREFYVQFKGVAGQTDMAEYVSLTDQRRMHITLPEVNEQQAIARVLGTLDDKIDLNRRMNETLESMARALFKSWFVDFDPVRAKAEGRDPRLPKHIADLFPNSFEESQVGEIPKNWWVRSLGDLTSYLNRGISPAYLDEGGVLVLNQKCVRDGRVDKTKGRRHDASKRSVDGRTLVQGDIMVNSTGVGTLGRVAQVLDLDEPTIVDSHVTVVRADGVSDSWNFLGMALRDREREIEALGEGSTGQTELSRSRLAALPVVLPAPRVMSEFDRLCVPLRAKTAITERSNRTLASVRDALLPKLISGELRILDVDRIVGGQL
jgi:type I restriction enzyme S subunit